jgi:hypothetical protein
MRLILHPIPDLHCALSGMTLFLFAEPLPFPLRLTLKLFCRRIETCSRAVPLP